MSLPMSWFSLFVILFGKIFLFPSKIMRPVPAFSSKRRINSNYAAVCVEPRKHKAFSIYVCSFVKKEVKRCKIRSLRFLLPLVSLKYFSMMKTTLFKNDASSKICSVGSTWKFFNEICEIFPRLRGNFGGLSASCIEFTYEFNINR